jgi:hypothetical protein
MFGTSQVFQTISHGGDNFETVIYLSHQEKTNVRGDLGALKIYHDGPVKIRPDHLFLAFTTIEHLGVPDLLNNSPYIR